MGTAMSTLVLFTLDEYLEPNGMLSLNRHVHPPETWDIMMDHMKTNFFYCPNVLELWLVMDSPGCPLADQLLLWEKR
jgi:hypothetical protein